MSSQNMSDHFSAAFLWCLETGSQKICLIPMCNGARKNEILVLTFSLLGNFGPRSVLEPGNFTWNSSVVDDDNSKQNLSTLFHAGDQDTDFKF